MSLPPLFQSPNSKDISWQYFKVLFKGTKNVFFQEAAGW